LFNGIRAGRRSRSRVPQTNRTDLADEATNLGGDGSGCRVLDDVSGAGDRNNPGTGCPTGEGPSPAFRRHSILRTPKYEYRHVNERQGFLDAIAEHGGELCQVPTDPAAEIVGQHDPVRTRGFVRDIASEAHALLDGGRSAFVYDWANQHQPRGGHPTGGLDNNLGAHGMPDEKW
jgi:hypothetical protein